jgi:hypothetical protein
MTSPEVTLRFVLSGQPYDHAYARAVPRAGDQVLLQAELFTIEGITWIYGEHTNGLQTTFVDVEIIPVRPEHRPTRYE